MILPLFIRAIIFALRRCQQLRRLRHAIFQRCAEFSCQPDAAMLHCHLLPDEATMLFHFRSPRLFVSCFRRFFFSRRFHFFDYFYFARHIADER
jgi:hypothetical protein